MEAVVERRRGVVWQSQAARWSARVGSKEGDSKIEPTSHLEQGRTMERTGRADLAGVSRSTAGGRERGGSV